MARGCGQDIYYLDFRENDLYGWEDRKSRLVVASLAEQIFLGANIPLVDVFQRENRVFELATPDGGHNRALAYFYLKRALPCRILDTPLSEPTPIDITKIKLVDDSEARKEDCFSYRAGNGLWKNYSGNNRLINSRMAFV